MIITIYETLTDRIKRQVSCPEAECASQCADGESYVIGAIEGQYLPSAIPEVIRSNSATYYVQVADSRVLGIPHLLTDSPGDMWLPCNYGDYIPGRCMIGEPTIYPDKVEYPIVEIPVEVLLATCKAKQSKIIRQEGARQLKALQGDYSDAEVKTWFKQEKEANAFLADPSILPAMINGIALDRGISLSELVDKIMENVTLFDQAAGAILGQQQKLLDRIKAAATEAEVIEIAW